MTPLLWRGRGGFSRQNTSTAAVVPLVLATGAGSEVRHALGVAVFAGMLGVTVFGLFLTPVFYVALRTLTERRRRAPATGDDAALGTSRG